MMKNAFYFTSKAVFILKIFKVLARHFGHVAKRFDQKDMDDFKIYDVTVWLTNNCNIHIVQYLEKYGQSDNETFFFKTYTENVVEKLASNSFLEN